MKKLIFLTVIILAISCKEKSQTTTVHTEIESKPLTESDLGDLYQYYHASASTRAEKDENTLIAYAAEKGYKPTRTKNGVYIVMKEQGTGKLLKDRDQTRAHYTGTYLDGEKFDSSFDRGVPLDFAVGDMIAGWNEALITMHDGDKAILLIPSHLAYGPEGIAGLIPGNANLIFEIELMHDL